MAHTIVLFQADHTHDGTFLTVAPIGDPTIREEGNFIYLKHLLNIIGGNGFGGVGATRMYFESPELRKVNYFEVTPLEVVLLPTECIDQRIQPDSPITLPESEPIRCLLEGGAGAVGYVTGVLWLSDGIISPVTGDIFHSRLTATITEVAGVWVQGEMVWDQPLPVGRYAIVGARCESVDDGVAFRLISLDQVHRPGGLCVVGPECPDLREQRNGGLGTWMEFDHDSPPQLEVASTVGGDAVQEITLDLIKLS